MKLLRALLLLMLWLVGPGHTEEAFECPAQSRLQPICQMKLGSQCSTDDDCDIWQRCCETGCGRRCVMSFKPGDHRSTCPDGTRLHYVCRMNFTSPCDGNNSCGHWALCCNTECGPRCVSQWFARKPTDQCPEEDTLSKFCRISTGHSCQDSQDCDGYHLCCDAGCGKKCTPKCFTGENGTCPFRGRLTMLCNTTLGKDCRNDTQCDVWQRCCLAKGCGGKCVPTFISKFLPKKCPEHSQVSFLCKKSWIQSCEDDDDCPSYKQCCDIGCGKKCIYSFRRGERPGECSSPSQLSYVCNTTLGRECQSESDCGRWGTCCFTPCGSRCVLKHFRDDNGQCPRPDHLACVCNSTFGRVCESDGDCAGSQRCCDAGCQKRCVPSFYRKSDGDWGKSEQCPKVSSLDRVCRMNHSISCEDNEDCGKWTSCCETPCGRRCVHSFMGQNRNVSVSVSVTDRTFGMCPSPQRLSAVCDMKYGELCEDDNDCYAWQTCCNTSCGQRCVHSFHGRRSEERCPSASRLRHVCSESFHTQCDKDSDCEDWQTCCNTSCGNRCVSKFLTRSTQCPASTRLDPFCEMKLGDVCMSDADCFAWSSCCDANCGKRCVPRFLMGRDESCPAPHRLEPMCDMKLGDQCNGDEDCDAWQSCCQSKCGKVCIPSIMDDDDEGDCPDRYRAKWICERNSSMSCVRDEDCRSWEQCCDVGCGRRCVRSSSLHKGGAQCPQSSALGKVCTMKLGDECEADTDCDRWQMCCDAGCGKRCVFRFFKGENRSCPAAERLTPMCDINYGQECRNDDDCDLWLSCCEAGCGKRCVRRYYAHETGKRDAQCPKPSQTQHICDRDDGEECEGDDDCTRWKRCCQVGDCGKRCVYGVRRRAEAFECPAQSRLQPICQMKLGSQCSTDDDCDIWQRCCETGCGKRCVMSFKPGEHGSTCPDGTRLHYVCRMNFTSRCDGDDSCGHWASCCNTECGPRCVSQWFARKPTDQCPEEDTLSKFCRISTGHSCQDSQDCDGYHLCCDAGCGKKCTPKCFTGENGTCPFRGRLTMLCNTTLGKDCRNDTQCDVWQRCCLAKGCGGKCVPTFISKFLPKKCPEHSQVSFLCKKSWIQSCEDDDDCPSYKQCCDIGCGKKCIYSFRRGERPGECSSPSQLSYVCNTTLGRECKSESDCGRWGTCCFTPCGSRCVLKHFRDDNGQCPRPDHLACVCNSTFGRVCESDGDCAGSQRCCDAGCQKRCVPSFYRKSDGDWGKSEQCPKVSSLDRVCRMNHSISCEDNEDCGKWTSCCETPCGRRCVHSFMGQNRNVSVSVSVTDRTFGMCPSPQRLSAVCDMKYGELCEDDNDCYAWQTCCNTSCGQRCVHSFHGRRSEERCPSASRLRHVCSESFHTQCDKDSDCEDWQTCCNTSCGNRCVSKFLTRSTQCPASTRLDPFCEMKLGDVCMSDADCFAWSSCCDANCGKRCVPRFLMGRDDSCPAPHRLEPMCDMKLGDQCNGDEDCDAWQSCCQSKCGKVCIPSIMDDDEEGDCPDRYRAKWICERNSSMSCVRDEDCRSWEQCCDVGCGRRCVRSSSLHKGGAQCPQSSALGKVCTMKLGDECEADTDCDRWQMCCDAGCGKRCVFRFFKGENRSCPAAERLTPMCDINYGQECRNDDDCDLWLSCCEAGCGKRCVRRYYAHETGMRDAQCPKPSQTQHICDRDDGEECEGDDDCTRWKRCCQVGDCGKRCVYGVRRRAEAFECPAQSRLQPICQMKLGSQCSTDDDCDIWQRCCETGCGKRCVMSFKPGEHGSTCPDGTRLHYVCRMNFTSRCDGDDSCGHWASCCNTECGPRCVSQWFARKPTDQCPEEDTLSKFCRISTGHSCQDSQDCDGYHLCCDAGCGKKCTPKCFTGENGTCPFRGRLTMLCNTTLGKDCRNDTQCDVWQRCCLAKGCGGKCVPTFISKFLPKKCPEHSQVSFLCKKSWIQSCEDDDDCPSYKQCCDIGCGKKCIYSFRRGERPGECSSPSQLSYVCNTTLGRECQSESDCGRWGTCCFTPCGSRCVLKHFRDDNGQCPRPDHLACVCNSTFGRVCESDGDCAGSQRCCDAGCQKRCVPSFYRKSDGDWGKSEQCPKVSSLDRVCRMNHSISCEDNEDCGKWTSCCETPCGRRCVHSFMGQNRNVSVSVSVTDRTFGMCPSPQRLSAVCDMKYGELCEDDNDCYAWQTCCNTSCGQRCVHSFHGRRSEERCPSASRLRHVCSESFHTQCDKDSDCEDWQTCCNTSCGNRCVSKFLTRSTQCPASTRLDPFCEMKLGDVCMSDADCFAWSSCCDANCGKRCVPRFLMGRDDSCPAPHRLEPMCDMKLGDQCNGDEDCDAWQSCCQSKCGKVCIPSIMDDDEEGDCPDRYRAKWICERNSSMSCVRDEDCRSWEQCCDVGCGRRCVRSSSLHKGGAQCPQSSALGKVCTMKLGDECEADTDCDRWQMCCDAGCGKRCVFRFFKGENRSCPAAERLTPMCDINYGQECQNDDDCDLWLSCCEAGCGKRCVRRYYAHETGKRDAQCPKPSQTQHICDRDDGEECEGDDDCTRWKRCCQVGDCGKRCVYGVRRRAEAFECPAQSRLQPICQMKLGSQCSTDDDCDIWQRCCETGCGKRCVMSFKPGEHGSTCPDGTRLHYVCRMNFTSRCDGDDSCGHWASCCNTECGPRCVSQWFARKPTDQCPEEDTLSKFCRISTGHSCQDSQDCDGYHLCCDAGCGKKCTPKCFTGENGTCPFPGRLTMLCNMTLGKDCRNDTQCDVWQRCCLAKGCGGKCVPTFISKFLPKKCPEHSQVSFLCKKSWIQSCEDDDDCPSYKQCCDIGCGKKCIYSFRRGERPGECSSPSQLSYVCNTTLGRECKSESDCGRWGTCCFTPCGSRCVLKHFRDDNGQCPRPDHLACVCNSTFGRVCESDGDCAGSQRCCDAGCQKRCVPSFYRKSDGDWGKSEQCPKVSSLDRVCRMNHSISCEDNEDCGKWTSCCETPCGRRCVHSFMGQNRNVSVSVSVTDRTFGMCPSPQRLSAVCDMKYGELCEDDNDCYAWQTCCNTSCGQRCVHSFHGRRSEERCPSASRLRHVCSESFHTQCDKDSDCEDWQTCCNTSCGNRCVSKFLTRSTQCPASTRLDPFCEMKLGDVCMSDADCFAWSSCCDANCGKRCVPRFLMGRDDSCPAPHRLEPMCDMKLGDQCNGDEDCDAWQSCCQSKCGKVCIPSIMDDDEEGDCPDRYRAKWICERNSSMSCVRDEDCRSWEQCCDVGCGRRCVRSSSLHKGGAQCPQSSALGKVCTMKLGDECEADTDCDRWQMCCDAGCGKRCVFRFFKGENRSCPAAERLTPMCDINYGQECRNDDDCDLWLSCCEAGCGKRCVRRYYAHETGKRDAQCPKPSQTQHICDRDDGEECEGDDDCTRWKRCCQVGDCGKRCVYGVRRRAEAFECPAQSRLQPICQMKLGSQCSTDDDCDIWQRCCETGCGKRCVMSFKPGEHGSTCPDGTRLHYVCRMNFTSRCDGDDSCGHWASCCNTECGPRCVSQWFARKPTDQCPEEDTLSKFCRISTGHSCQDSQDCDGYHLCCDAGCGKKCTPKCFTGENGTCPFPGRLTMLCNTTLGKDCRNDTQCDVWQRCCLAKGCGGKCVPTFISKFLPKKCPEHSQVSFLCKKSWIQSCEDDDDCPSYKQCCDIGCGKKCIYSFRRGERPGECSSPSQLSYVCNTTLGRECKSESDCGRWGTCCFTPCGSRCVLKHFRDDNGQCPRPDHLACVCNSTFGRVCESDGDCAGSQRCCDAGCQKRCVPSFYRKSDGDWGKSEQCPKVSSLDRVCRMNHSISCEDNEDCGKWTSCCETPCGRRCVHSFMGQNRNVSVSVSVTDRTFGMCPSPQRLSAVCDMKYGELCEDDNDCYAWQTCCNTSCGQRCVHSFHGRRSEERCPSASRLRHVCSESFHTQCDKDSDCEDWQTCCNTSCGNRCVSKFLTRSTQCPASTRLDPFCEMKLGDVCMSDADCFAWSSCCDANCGKRCVPRFLMGRDDSCPAPHRLEPMCDMKLGDQCNGDEDCDAWQSCCQSKCGKVCIPSIMDDDEEGDCPDRYRAKWICERNSSMSCVRDEDCRSWEQCCDVGCGRRCVRSSSLHKGGAQCPQSSALGKVCTMKLGDECEADTDCDRWQMCCDAGCGRRCVFRFFKGENRSCPAAERLTPMCDINYGQECRNDDDCDLWLSCCEAGCGKRCVRRYYAHGKRDAQCPKPSQTQHICDRDDGEECEGDDDCTRWKRCCQVGDCGKRCVYGVRRRAEAFECPAQSRLQPICQMKLGSQCSTDDDCDIWQRCCETGCGKRCVMSFKPGEHGSTCPDGTRLHYVCRMNFTSRCDGDDSCGHWASCCNTECGPRCVSQWFARKPTDQCPEEDTLSKFCRISTGHSCQDSQDCDGYHLCCDAGCGKKCTPKCFTGENGTCPFPGRLTMLCNTTLGKDCRNDTQCDVWQRCCLAKGCGGKCVPTFISKFLPKKCPEHSQVSFLCKKSWIQSCEDDDDCPSYKQCCDIGCGKKCIYSFRRGERPGECSSPSQLSYVCNTTLGRECKSESDCGRWGTCCFTPCGSRCVLKHFRDDNGQCPRPDHLACVCNSTFGRVCESDGDCAGSQRCCDAGCQKRCVPSFYRKSDGDWGKSEQCPKVSSLDRVCRMNHSISCEDNEDCGKWTSCCETPCGRRCVHSFMGQNRNVSVSVSVTDRTFGMCPSPQRLSAVCDMKYGELCEDDNDCYAWQTCCNTSCGQRCVHSFHGRRSEERCPSASRLRHVCSESFHTQCDKDSDCEDWQTCCNTSCGNRCVSKFLTRSTQCPASTRLDPFCEMKLGDVCMSDADCFAWSSCCDANCGKRCVPRFLMGRDDSCPAPHRLEPMCDMKLGDQCNGDEDCDAWQSCCQSKCGKVCIPSIMDDDEEGDCPDRYRAKWICERNSSMSCVRDEDCRSWEQCCDVGCGRRCVRSSSLHKGGAQCPQSSALGKVCTMKLGDECEADTDCDRWQMCCDAGCGKRCVFRFFKGENRSCPAAERLTPMCDINYGQECRNDDDCDLWLSCCEAGCGKRCVRRYYAHETGKRDAQCPKPSQTQHICDRDDGEECEGDDDCTRWKRCCQVGDCGKRCVYGVRRRAEGFECPAQSRLQPICQMKLGSQCSTDDDCDIWQRCCETGCGKRCVMSFKPGEHGSTCPDGTRLHYVCRMNFTSRCDGDDSCGHWASCCNTECGPRCLSQWFARKPTDQCPEEDTLSKFCRISTGHSCQDSQDCDGYHLCCDAGCGKKCTPKCFTGENGTCPFPGRLTMLCNTTLGKDCRNDTQCDVWQRCCLAKGCGGKCVPTFISKFLPKKCPEHSQVSFLCKKSWIQSCEDDDDCPSYKQCCDIGCGKKCIYSFRRGERPGECSSPSQLSYVCNTTLGRECQSESDCGRWGTCCFTPCGSRCVLKHFRDDNGQCPRPDHLACVCNSTFGRVCESDGDCAGSQRCCDAGCQKRCVPSFYRKSDGDWGKSEQCPEVSSLDRVCRMNHSISCEDNEDCGKWTSCCETPCGRRCVHSFMGQNRNVSVSVSVTDRTFGMCPSPQRLSAVCDMKYGELCEDDNDCYAWQTCCNTSCGQRCVHSFHGRRSEERCPSASRLRHVCSESFHTQCDKDSDCEDWQTCCNTSCGNRCVSKFLTRSTQCPASTRLDPFCEMKLGDVCMSDADCFAWSSCCDANCGKRCVPRFLMGRDDSCPAPHRLEPMCDMNLGDQCNGDEDCDAWQSCCQSKCGKVCIPSIMDDDEEGDCPDRYRAKWICERNSSMSCVRDEDCRSWEQCCDVGCGRRCVRSSSLHKGGAQCPQSSALGKVCTMKLGDECEADTDCDRWQMCCDAGCGRRCVFRFFKGENRSCPAAERLTPMCDINYGQECRNDDDCDLWLSCCEAGCGKRCVRRYYAHGKRDAQCPKPSQTQHICDRDDGEECEGDDDCTRWKRCCQVGDCGKRCVYGVRRRENCRSDGDCSPHQQCCKGQCQLKCKSSADDPTQSDSEASSPGRARGGGKERPGHGRNPDSGRKEETRVVIPQDENGDDEGIAACFRAE
ncbi:uncharacterized protein LOC125450177 isoform X2 [Stegostoma tigrinum]|uniref:uncharacterized protein LOC125450177 isoform X2 n=1 Tax=Stegostoma tigrinum TaxID=3053191 RepID=UPI00287034CD|nr:uncharacterized protein LOC125450177 isoform X2 [Stegostoma tigrinum]